MKNNGIPFETASVIHAVEYTPGAFKTDSFRLENRFLLVYTTGTNKKPTNKPLVGFYISYKSLSLS
jgi:hypothetical protein